MHELALFAGAGGGILGGHLLGWRCVCAVECDAYAASVLVARQNDGCLAPFPVWDDVRTFDGRPWQGRVDVVSGGFPCQDISAAGKGTGIDGERSGLWSEMARIIGEVRPRYVLVENSPMLTSRGLGRVLGDLATLGYDAEWGVLGAVDAGAPHKRERIWILAYSAVVQQGDSQEHAGADASRPGGQAGDGAPRGAGEGTSRAVAHAECAERRKERRSRDYCREDGDSQREEGTDRARGCSEDVADAYGERLEGGVQAGPAEGAVVGPGTWGDRGWWEAEPDVGRVANGVASRMDRLRCIGNGQVPAVVRLAWETLREAREAGR